MGFQLYPPSEGFGRFGIPVNSLGQIFVFRVPVTGVLIRNATSNPAYYGFNFNLVGPTVITYPIDWYDFPNPVRLPRQDRLLTVDLDDFVSRSSVLGPLESTIIRGDIYEHGRRGIRTVCFASAFKHGTTVHGGAVHM